MSNQLNKKKRKILRIIILTIIAVVSIVVSIYMNVVGMKAAINRESDSSGMAGISVRKKDSNTTLSSNIKTKVDNDGNVVEDDILIDALPIIELNNNGWDRLKAKYTGFELDENGNAIFKDKGYTFYCNGTYVNYIVFNQDFKGKVAGDIKIGTDFKDIEKKLGSPTFSKNNCIGYKTREDYIFFYDNEAAVYPVNNDSNKDFEELLNSYKNKTYGKDRTYFLVDIRKNFPDFEITQDNTDPNTVILKSIKRQIVVTLDGLGNCETVFYNGYTISSNETQNYIDEKMYSVSDDDLVEITENERINGSR